MLSDNSNKYDETMTYDNNGNVTKLHRCGKMQKSTNGNVDELTTMEYSGNQLTARRYHYQRDVVVAGETPTSPVTA